MKINNYLIENTRVFANAFSQVVGDMLGMTYELSGDVREVETFRHTPGVVVSIHFSGIIQGEYILALEEKTAAALIGVYDPDDSEMKWKMSRDDYMGACKEILNTCVGLSILKLEKRFEGLTFLPAIVTYGEIEYPVVPAGIQAMQGPAGDIDCCFMLNMMNLGVGEKLQSALLDIQRKNGELREAQRNITSMLEVFPAGLVSIDKTGIILPGYSRMTAKVVGLNEQHTIASVDIFGMLGIPNTPEHSLANEFRNWIDVVFMKWGDIDYSVLDGLLPVSEFTNVRGRILRLKCIPVTDADKKSLARLLFVIDDVTEQREIEKRMVQLSKLHDQNLELLSQIINLEPDEITIFVFDSSELITRAESILKSQARDKDFINQLYRTIHTLKGTSGQFRFKQLQVMAHTIESQLSSLKEKETVEEQDVVPIEQAIEEVNNYISRIEDVRKKLGGEKETLKDKTLRSQPSMMVRLDTIDRLIKAARDVSVSAEKLDKGSYFQRATTDLAEQVQRLRQLNLSFFVPSLATLAQRTAEREGKKVTLSLEKDISLDVVVARRLHETFVHIVNNAVSHGVELPHERLSRGKLETGLVRISTCQENGYITIRIADDGQGVDYDKIRQRLVDKGLSRQDADRFTESELNDYLFQSGFSTKDDVSEISGRGIGMDVVAATLKEFGGCAKIISERNKGTEIVLQIPLSAAYPTLGVEGKDGLR